MCGPGRVSTWRGKVRDPIAREELVPCMAVKIARSLSVHAKARGDPDHLDHTFGVGYQDILAIRAPIQHAYRAVVIYGVLAFQPDLGPLPPRVLLDYL